MEDPVAVAVWQQEEREQEPALPIRELAAWQSYSLWLCCSWLLE